MPKKLDDCVKELIAQGKTEEQAWAICKSKIKDSKPIEFNDKLNITINKGKRSISVRDGVQYYKGFEIGKEPFDKTFSVYRSPQTIASIVDKMLGLPVTDDHVDLSDIPDNKIVGKVISSELLEFKDENTNTTCVIRNEIEFTKNMLLYGGKNELSLGYFADLVEHDVYDFEQVDIIPHHLAVVERARCGNLCKFTDKGGQMAEETRKEQAPQEENAQTQEQKQESQGQEINLQKIAEVVKDLPEAIKLMNIEELKGIIPILQEAINKARENTPEMQEQNANENMQEDGAEEKTEEKTEVTDSQVDFKDSQEFKDAVMQYGNERAEIILKAKTFLDEGYEFKDKDNLTIMREVLAKETKEQFSDAEVPVAFKMLKKFKDYSKFGDAKPVDEFDKLKDKEV